MSEINWISDPELETGVLACAFINAEAADIILSLLTPEDFNAPKIAAIFKAIRSIHGDGERADALTVKNWLTKNEPQALDWRLLTQITDLFPMITEIKSYCVRLREFTNRRKAHALALDLRRRLENCENATDVLQELKRAAEDITDIGSVKALREYIPPTLDRWAKLKEKADGAPRWYLKRLNQLLGPLHGSQVIVLAGAAKSGKTTFMFSQAVTLAALGHKVGYFALEMSAQQMLRRLVIFQTKNDPYRLPVERLDEAAEALNRYADLPLFIDDRNRDLVTILSGIRRFIHAGCKVVFLDYLGLIRHTGKANRNEFLGQVMQSLKAIAMEFDVDVIVGCQLNRDSRKQARPPELHDLRDSGNIEQDSDLIIFIDRADQREESHYTDIDVKANRHGPTGTVRAEWDHGSQVLRDSAVTNTY